MYGIKPIGFMRNKKRDVNIRHLAYIVSST